MPRPQLITIGPSHYCEKARWALERAGIGFDEKAHAPLLHYAATLPHRQKTTPLFVTAHGLLRDSTAIVKHADKFLDADKRLFPEEGALRAEVERWEDLFDDKLGPATRRVAYFHLLDHAALVNRAVGDPLGPLERALFVSARPVLVAMMKKGMKIDAAGAARSEERIATVLDQVEERLRGERYLAGARFTAADLTLAALMAPLVLPVNYGWPLPPVDDVPGSLRQLVERYRNRPAGAFVLRVYSDHRKERVGKG